MPRLPSIDAAIAEILPRCRGDNPAVYDKDVLQQIAFETIIEVMDNMSRKYYEIGTEPNSFQKAEIIALCTNIGLSDKTAESLYEDITTGFLEPGPKTPPS